jgi:hypothetical protein
MNQLETPVAFFIFRRPETSRRVFEQIKTVKPKTLYIISDGPRDGNPQEKDLVTKTREAVEDIDWPCKVTKVYSDVNIGLRERILTGLDEVFAREQQAIVLEDDCLPSRSFFSFSSEMLAKYANKPNIALVSGSNFAPSKKVKEDYFFSRSTYIWGWATWQRAWHEFRNSPQVETWSEKEITELKSTFASKFQMKEFIELMRIAHSLNTWDVSLAVWVRQASKLTIVPRLNLIENIGFGEGATHTKFEAFDAQVPKSDFETEISHPGVIEPDNKIEQLMWLRKRSRWITFPLSHPLLFLRAITNYLKNFK